MRLTASFDRIVVYSLCSRYNVEPGLLKQDPLDYDHIRIFGINANCIPSAELEALRTAWSDFKFTTYSLQDGQETN